VKNRSQVSGGGRKPWRQKGTGRERQGSVRAPQGVGGGVAFGPAPRSYSYKLPKKVRRLALQSALSSNVKDDNVMILDGVSVDTPNTRKIVEILDAFNVEDKTLIVTAEPDEVIVRSANNLPTVNVLSVDKINVLDLLAHDKLIMTKDAAEK